MREEGEENKNTENSKENIDFLLNFLVVFVFSEASTTISCSIVVGMFSVDMHFIFDSNVLACKTLKINLNVCTQHTHSKHTQPKCNGFIEAFYEL
jgi:hypothetical protein